MLFNRIGHTKNIEPEKINIKNFSNAKRICLDAQSDKFESKTKKGAKIGAAAGGIVSSLCIAKAIPNVVRDITADTRNVITKSSIAGVVAGFLFAAAYLSSIGAAAGAVLGKTADVLTKITLHKNINQNDN